MKQHRPARSRLFVLILLFLALFAAAQVYKWVDDEGQVHFGDMPPEKQKSEEVELPEGPSAQESDKAIEELSKSLESRRALDEIRKKAASGRQNEKELKRARKEESFKTCVRATHQSNILKIQVRIFKLNNDWSRSYLEDEERELEIIRFDELIRENCRDDPDFVTEQYTKAMELGRALNIQCVNPREKLAREPGGAKAKEYRTYLDENCPDIDPRSFWIADWIHR